MRPSTSLIVPVQKALSPYLTTLWITDSETPGLSVTKRAELRGVISTKPGLNRYLRVTPGGLLRVNAAAIKAEANLDGKYLLRASDPKLSAEDIALGYKQLLEVERGWRDLKQVIDLRPVYHRNEQRIRAHVVLCWLALLLTRLVETTCADTWPQLRRELDRIAVGTFTGPAGVFRQRTEINKPQRDILTMLHLDPPPRIYQLTPADARPAPTHPPRYTPSIQPGARFRTSTPKSVDQPATSTAEPGPKLRQVRSQERVDRSSTSRDLTSTFRRHIAARAAHTAYTGRHCRPLICLAV
jgi:hypothetical protein